MKNHNFISAALFAGIMAILSQFAFPIGAVPITLQSFVCALAGGVLGKKWGAISIGLWLILGMIGIPVLTRHRHIPLPSRRLLSGLRPDGFDQRIQIRREGQYFLLYRICHSWTYLLLCIGNHLVHGILPVRPWKGHASLDSFDHDGIPVCCI